MKKFLVLGITTIVMVIALCLMFISCTAATPPNTNKVGSETTVEPETTTRPEINPVFKMEELGYDDNHFKYYRDQATDVIYIRYREKMVMPAWAD